MRAPDPTGGARSPDAPPHTRELLDLLDAVERKDNVTQRTLAEQIGVAVGLANALVKRAVRKGLIKVSEAPVRRYAYYLTPDGFAEKSRLVAEYLHTSLSFFRRARREYLELLEQCARRGQTRIVLVGAGELAEIAVMAAHECNVTVVAVLDARTNRDRVCGLPVIRTLKDIETPDAVVITSSDQPLEAYEISAAEIGAERVFAPVLLRIRRAAAQS